MRANRRVIPALYGPMLDDLDDRARSQPEHKATAPDIYPLSVFLLELEVVDDKAFANIPFASGNWETMAVS